MQNEHFQTEIFPFTSLHSIASRSIRQYHIFHQLIQKPDPLMRTTALALSKN